MEQKKYIIELLNNSKEIITSCPKNALKSIKDAYITAENIKDDNLIAECSYYLGYIYLFIGKYKEAILYIEKALEISDSINNKELVINNYNLLGKINFYYEDYETSLDFYTKALKKADYNNYYHLKVSLLNNIGEIYHVLGYNEKAIEYFQQNVKLMSIDKLHSHSQSITLGLFASTYIELNKIQLAHHYIKEGREIALKRNDFFSEAYSLRLLGCIYEKIKENNKALDYFKKSIEKYHEIYEHFYILDSYISYNKLLIKQQKYKESISSLKEALIIANNNDLENKILKIYYLLAQVYEGVNNLEMSIYYYKLINDIETNKEKQKIKLKVNSLANKYEKIKSDQEKEIYRLKNIELKSKKNELEKRTIELTKEYDNIKIINDIVKNITSTLNIDKILNTVYLNINKLMNTNAFGVGFYDDEKEKLYYRLFIEDGVKIPNFYVDINNSQCYGAWAIQNNEEILIKDRNNKKWKLNESNIVNFNKMATLLFFPLTVDNRVIGIITLQSIQKNAFTNYQIDTLKTLTPYIAIALNNAIESEKLAVEVKERKRIQNKLEEANNKLFHLSMIDGLTGLYNRHAFYAQVEDLFNKSREESGFLSMIMIDIDFFKPYNDNYGHLAGDECLKKICNELMESSKNEDAFMFRYGGDEIIIIVQNMGKEELIHYANKLHTSINNLRIFHEYSEISDQVTTTMGIVSLPVEKVINYKSIIDMVDKALYKAKENGRNRIEVFSEIGKYISYSTLFSQI